MLSSIVLAGCLIAAEPAGNEALKAQVQSLVLKLDDDSAEVRTKAERQLIALGPAALDLLPSPDSQHDAAPREALLRIRKTLEDAEAQAYFASSTVSLHGRLKRSKVVAEIRKQTGNNITGPSRAAGTPVLDAELNVDFDKTPFWSAVDEVLDQTKFSVYPYQPETLQLVPRGPNDLPRAGRATVAGPLRIEPVSVRASRNLRSKSPSVLQLGLEVAWEPRLRPISVKLPMSVLKAVGSNGAAIEAFDPKATLEGLPRTGSSALEMDVALAMPPAGTREIASLKGSLRVMILGKVEKFSFANLLGGKQEKRIAAATVVLTDVRKSGDVWEFYIQVRYDDAGDALESHRDWPLEYKAYLKGTDGKPIKPDSSQSTLRTPKEIGIAYEFALPKDASPATMTFVYETPGMVVTKDFPFELKGIKLP
jgi:hypothetical protein